MNQGSAIVSEISSDIGDQFSIQDQHCYKGNKCKFYHLVFCIDTQYDLIRPWYPYIRSSPVSTYSWKMLQLLYPAVYLGSTGVWNTLNAISVYFNSRVSLRCKQATAWYIEIERKNRGWGWVGSQRLIVEADEVVVLTAVLDYIIETLFVVMHS